MSSSNNPPEFVKYGSINTLVDFKDIRQLGGRELKVFEKVDGGNCQIRNQGGWNLLPGSKANFLRGANIERWPWFGKFVSWAYNNPSLYNIPDDVIVFGEWMGNHTIHYAPENIDRFVVLDVMRLPEKKFMDYEDAQEFLDELGVEDVRFLPVKASGGVDEERLEKILFEGSDFYEGPVEGLVIKDYGSDPQEFYRIYHPDFTEVLPRKGSKPDYLTSARFRKNILRAVEETDRDVLSEEEVIRYVTYDVSRDVSQVPPVNVVKSKLRSLRDSGVLEDVRDYIEGYVSEDDALVYLTPKRVRKVAGGLSKGGERFSYTDLVSSLRDYAISAGESPSEEVIQRKLNSMIRQGVLGKLEKRINYE